MKTWTEIEAGIKSLEERNKVLTARLERWMDPVTKDGAYGDNYNEYERNKREIKRLSDYLYKEQEKAISKDKYRLEYGKLFKYQSPTVPGTAGSYEYCFYHPDCLTITKAIEAYEAQERLEAGDETMTPEAVAYRKHQAAKAEKSPAFKKLTSLLLIGQEFEKGKGK